MQEHPAATFDRRLDRFTRSGLVAGLLAANPSLFRFAPSSGFHALGLRRIGDPAGLDPAELDRRMSVIEAERERLAARDLAFVERYYRLATIGLFVSRGSLLALILVATGLIVLGHEAIGLVTLLALLAWTAAATMTSFRTTDAEPPTIHDGDVAFDWEAR